MVQVRNYCVKVKVFRLYYVLTQNLKKEIPSKMPREAMFGVKNWLLFLSPPHGDICDF